MPREQNAGQNHNIQIGTKSSERVEQFRYLDTHPNESKYHSLRI